MLFKCATGNYRLTNLVIEKVHFEFADHKHTSFITRDSDIPKDECKKAFVVGFGCVRWLDDYCIELNLSKNRNKLIMFDKILQVDSGNWHVAVLTVDGLYIIGEPAGLINPEYLVESITKLPHKNVQAISCGGHATFITTDTSIMVIGCKLDHISGIDFIANELGSYKLYFSGKKLFGLKDGKVVVFTQQNQVVKLDVDDEILSMKLQGDDVLLFSLGHIYMLDQNKVVDTGLVPI